MGLIATVADRVFDVLDAIMPDDRQVHFRKVISNQGLEIKGVWETKEIFLFGEPLTFDVLDRNNVAYGESSFFWGDDSEESDVTALAILLWFLDKDEALRTKDLFLRDFVLDFPQEDFESKFCYEFWRNMRMKKEHQRPVSVIDEAPSMDDD